MKVIEKGHWYDVWEKEVVCSTADCKAKLLIGEEDVIAPARYDNAPELFKVVCPVCKKDTHLAKKDIPLRVVDNLNNKRVVHRTYPNPYD